MQWHRQLVFPVALGIVIGLVSSGATLLWHQTPAVPSHAVMVPTGSLTTAPTERVTRTDLDTFHAELARLQDSKHGAERLVPELQRDLASLRTRLDQMEQAQKTMSQSRAQLSTKQAARHEPEAPAPDAHAHPLPATAEDAVIQADRQMQAHMDLLEETLLGEAPDPAWTDAAERSLHSVFHGENRGGFSFVQTECRRTVCRLDLALDGSVSPAESFRHLIPLMPWQGQAFVHIEDGESAAVVVYLAREGHALPQALE